MIIYTLNTCYTLQDKGDGAWLIDGHHRYCPTPTLVRLRWMPVVGSRMVFEYVGESLCRSEGSRSVTTSPVVRINYDHSPDAAV